ncbi:MAG: 1-acyl-sn-glycerol-3-phosphate acyltransferase [Youngiibacter sp.]|nr:1-acyl-sn-glycerol-3-phosphate acyltransferase [Youngiibacter sp.]
MQVKGTARHLFVYKVLRKLLKPLVKSRMRFEAREETIGRQFLLLSNHNTNWDPLIIASSITDHMYFVASEHIFSWGYSSRIIEYLASPIPIFKGAPAAGTVLEILERIRAGHSIAIFAEGDRSFSGRTERIEPVIGKLARNSNVALVTFRIEGGYFTNPRWSDTYRKGQMKAGIVKVYEPETLKAMTVSEVNEAIMNDLYEDAYERQQKDKVEYKGRHLAEHLERLLFLCPHCKMTGTLVSKEDSIKCSCGFKVSLDSSGILHGNDLPFESVTDWDMWQRDETRKLSAEKVTGNIFSDGPVSLYTIGPSHERLHQSSGIISMTKEDLRIGESCFQLSSIPDMAIHGSQDLVFSCDRIYYELKSETILNAWKYLLLYRTIRGRDI